MHSTCERLPIREFIFRISEQLITWSELVDPTSPNLKEFAMSPKLSLRLQTESYNWARKNVSIKTRNKSGVSSFYIPPSGKPATRDCDILLYEKQAKTRPWKSFDTYAASQNKLWKVVMAEDDWISSTCTCKAYWKKYVCKHILGLAIRLNKFNVVPEAKTVPIGEKRKRGRPAKAKKALLR